MHINVLCVNVTPPGGGGVETRWMTKRSITQQEMTIHSNEAWVQ